MTSKNERWKIFIVGGARVKDPDSFLQVASWDGKIFRFYALEDIGGDARVRGWTYQGNSFDAFTDGNSYDASYLGPFNGHVNGACIMKELKKPWFHWYQRSGDFLDCLSRADRELFETIPYLTGTGWACFSGASVGSPYDLEKIVERTVSDWYDVRVRNDFCGKADPLQVTNVPKAQPSNVHRWMAHLLLTTTVNMHTSDFDSNLNKGQLKAPVGHFFHNDLLYSMDKLDILPYDIGEHRFAFSKEMYQQVSTELNLSLLQEVRDAQQFPREWSHVTLKRGILGGGKQTNSYELLDFLIVAENLEGAPFTILEQSYEDKEGVISMQSLGGLGDKFPESLLSTRAVRALIMLDFWNPIFSWRRGVMMQYLPETTTLVQRGDENVYDLEQKFVAAIRASSFVADSESPEHGFLELYDGPDDVYAYQSRLTTYLSAVNDRLKDKDGLRDYLELAESRRRIYRPLPLNEFGIQLPYAIGLPVDWPLIEMSESGSTQRIPERGMAFLSSWLGTLHGTDPRILPNRAGSTLNKYLSPSALRCPMRRASRL